MTRVAVRSAGTRWPPETRARALTLYATESLADAHRATGVPKATIRTWAVAAGIDPADVAEAKRRQTEAATAASVAARAERITSVLDNAEVKLAAILDISLDAQIAALRGGMIEDPDTGLSRRHPALGQVAPRDLVGMSTRALHDLQLLRGAATERSEGRQQIAVVFASAEPSPVPPAILDLPAIEVSHADDQ